MERLILLKGIASNAIKKSPKRKVIQEQLGVMSLYPQSA